MCVYVCICMCVFIYICIYIYIHTHIHIHIHTYSGPGEGYDESASLIKRLLLENPQISGYALSASVCLHNTAVSEYNAKKFSEAIIPLRALCEMVDVSSQFLTGKSNILCMYACMYICAQNNILTMHIFPCCRTDKCMYSH